MPRCARWLALCCLLACSGAEPAALALAADGGAGASGARASNLDAAPPAEGYCPGTSVDPQRPPCWDGKPGFCFQCIADSASDMRRPCMGAPNFSTPPAMASTPQAPVAMCRSDADCVLVGERCEPGAPGVDARGCRPRACTEGARCPAGTICDPALVGRPTLQPMAAISGCRDLRCDEPGGTACAAGYECASDGSGCRTLAPCDPTAGCQPLHCSAPGALPCAAPYKCNPRVFINRGCSQCATNTDCACGSCVHGRCYNRPGYCEPGCA